MNAIRNVLLATDGAPHSLDAVRALIALLPADGSAHVKVLTVLSYRMYPDRFSEGTVNIADEQDAVDAATVQAVRLLDEAGIKSDVAHRFGNPAAGILEECDEWQPQLIVLGSRGLRGAARLFGASVSQQVIKGSNLPVLIVPSSESPTA